MNQIYFMTAEEVAEILKVSTSYAYKIIRKFNKELEENGYFTMQGRINRDYFIERTTYKRKDDG